MMPATISGSPIDASERAHAVSRTIDRDQRDDDRAEHEVEQL